MTVRATEAIAQGVGAVEHIEPSDGHLFERPPGRRTIAWPYPNLAAALVALARLMPEHASTVALAWTAVDRIEFVVADEELGVGVQQCAEPVINGQSLVDLLARAEREPAGYAGLPPEELFRALRRPVPAKDVQVLRCICGDDLRSWARVDVETGPDEVVWRNVRASRADERAYTTLGPYRFAREGYERALAEPTRSDLPVRDRSA